MRIVVAGASGLIGTALVESLRADGVEVTTLVRRAPRAAGEVEWLRDSVPLDPGVLSGAAAVVGLNGASIGRFPWTPKYKSRLIWSRLTPTRTIANAVRQLGGESPAFVSASAVGFYGSAPGVPLDERAAQGRSFLAGLCAEWERAALTAGDRARVALLRTAPIVHRDGVLKPLIALTRAGVAGRIGRGTQAWPWISLGDEVRAIRHVLDSEISGPVNLSGPTRATANDLGFALAVRLRRPFVVAAPTWGLRLALGSDATEAILTSDAHVVPKVLTDTGFVFAQRTVEAAVDAAIPARP